jgi:hypothetical protein
MKLLAFAKRDFIIHVVTSGHNFKSWLCSLACAIAGRQNRRRSLLVFGSGNLPQYVAGAGFWTRLLIRYTLRTAGWIVCRNEQMQKSLLAAGAHHENLSIVPGFLVFESNSVGTIPEQIVGFLEKHSPILGATGGVEREYGIPLLIDCLNDLRKEYPDLGIVIIGPKQKSVQDHVLFTGPLPHDGVLSVMKKLNIFVRPTYFDGDSNSVREALALGLPVVASDTDFRPAGVILFKKGDREELVARIRETLCRRDGTHDPIEVATNTGSAEQLVGVYEKLMCRA